MTSLNRITVVLATDKQWSTNNFEWKRTNTLWSTQTDKVWIYNDYVSSAVAGLRGIHLTLDDFIIGCNSS